jgi:hypothetical protein
MPQNTSPIFALTPILAQTYLSGTYTDRTGVTSGLSTLVTAGTSGSKVTQIGAKFTGNTVTGSVLIFVTNASGTSPRLYDEIPVSAFTVVNATGSFRNVNTYSDLQINAGQLIQVGVTALSSSVSCSIFASQGNF